MIVRGCLAIVIIVKRLDLLRGCGVELATLRLNKTISTVVFNYC